MWIDVFGALRAAQAIDGCPRGLREVGHSSGLSGIDLCGSEFSRELQSSSESVQKCHYEVVEVRSSLDFSWILGRMTLFFVPHNDNLLVVAKKSNQHHSY